MQVLGYLRWENFEKILGGAKLSSTQAGEGFQNHFREVKKMVEIKYIDLTHDSYIREDGDTLFRFTGLKDKNGVKIFEGDTVGSEEVFEFIDRGVEWKNTDNIEDWQLTEIRTNTYKKDEKQVVENVQYGYRLYKVQFEEYSCGFEPFSDSKRNCGHCGGKLESDKCVVIKCG